MRHWIWLVMLAAVVFILGSLGSGARAQSGIELQGSLTANDMEREEGYFALAQDAVIMVRPGSSAHAWLKAHAGQSVRLVVEPAPTR